VLYISAEESAGQIKLRADRIGVAAAGLYLLADGSLDSIEGACRELTPALLIVDSIQAVADHDLSAPAGSLSQVRQCASRLIELAKSTDTAFCLAGHITKEGALAGPKSLEHMVDTVLYFEGARDRETRLLRSVKNRFGGVNELGVFRMGENGLSEIQDPASCFLEHRTAAGPGSALTASLQGNRVLLAEIQALVTDSVFSNVGRTSDGIEPNRVLRIKAIIDRRVGIPLAANDVFINVTGGLRLAEPGVDLAIAVAVAGSRTNRSTATALACVGEVSLLGELRRITQPAKRIAQARKLGLPTMLLPEANRDDCAGTEGIELLFAKTLKDALAIALAP
jgi:DNA repair protein RadA/Sms